MANARLVADQQKPKGPMIKSENMDVATGTNMGPTVPGDDAFGPTIRHTSLIGLKTMVHGGLGCAMNSVPIILNNADLDGDMSLMNVRKTYASAVGKPRVDNNSRPPIQTEKKARPTSHLSGKKRHYDYANTRSNREVALRVFNDWLATPHGEAVAGPTGKGLKLQDYQIQVDDLDRDSGIIILSRHRDLAPEKLKEAPVLAHLKGVLVHPGMNMVVSFNNITPQVVVNQNLDKALEELKVEAKDMTFYPGMQGLIINFTKWNGKVFAWSNTNLNIMRAGFDKYNVREMMRETGVDPDSFFGNKPTSSFTHTFMLVHKAFVRASKVFFEKPFLIHVRSKKSQVHLEAFDADDLEIEAVDFTPLYQPWGKGGIYQRQKLSHEDAKQWLMWGLINVRDDNDLNIDFHNPGCDYELPIKEHPGEHVYAEHKDGRTFVIESESHHWRQNIISTNINVAMNFYRLMTSPENLVKQRHCPSVESLCEALNERHILMWPERLPNEYKRVENLNPDELKSAVAPPGGFRAYDAFATLLLGSSLVNQREVFEVYEAYVEGVKKIGRFVMSDESLDVARTRLESSRMKPEAINGAIKELSSLRGAYKAKGVFDVGYVNLDILRQLIKWL